MDRFFAFIIGFVGAILILKYRRFIKEAFGEIGFAERFFGSGGTNTLIVIIALLVFILGLMYAMGTLQGIITSVFGPLF